MKLRDYQEEAIISTYQSFQSHRRVLGVAATGLGKTVIMGHLAHSWSQGRVMMLSHRYELNDQARRAFMKITGDSVCLEQAQHTAAEGWTASKIVVSSVQSLNQKRAGRYRFEKFGPQDFGLIMVDEAHHATAASYRRVLEYFKESKLVGVTATPDRLDKIGLEHCFDAVGFDYNINWGIENGWLCPIRQVVVECDGLDLSSVRTSRGDLHDGDLAQLVETEGNLHGFAKPIADLIGAAQCLVFAASVQQSRRLAELIRDYSHDSIVTAHIDGKTPPGERADIISGLRSGKIQVLCNCGVATEGFDLPGAEFVAIARPTKSRALYTQMVGRGTRPQPGCNLGTMPDTRRAGIASSPKPQCKVIDFVGQSGRHELVTTAHILAGESDPPEVIERANEIAKSQDFDQDQIEALREARRQLAEEEEERRKKFDRVTVGVSYGLYEQGHNPNLQPGMHITRKQYRYLRMLGASKDECQKLKSTKQGGWLISQLKR